MKIYDKIRDLTKEKGLTITGLEKELGFAKGSLSKIDKHMPSADRLDKLASRLGVNADWLMGKDAEDCMFSDRFRENVSMVIQNADTADIDAGIANGLDMGMISRVVEGNGSISLDTACTVADQLGESMDYLLDENMDITIKSVLQGEDGPIKEVILLMQGLPIDKQKQAVEILRVLAAPSKPQ